MGLALKQFCVLEYLGVDAFSWLSLVSVRWVVVPFSVVCGLANWLLRCAVFPSQAGVRYGLVAPIGTCGDAFPIEGVLVATYLLSVEALPHCRCGVANKNRIV